MFPMVEPSGGFLAQWAKDNGSFEGFKNKSVILTKLWDSKAGNKMARVTTVIKGDEEKQMYNMPAGIFIKYDKDNPGSGLVVIENGEWAINPEAIFSYDPKNGIKME